MRRRSTVLQQSWRAVHGALTAVLCAVMIAPPAWAAEGIAAEGSGARGAGTGSAIPVESHAGSHAGALTQQEKVLHALNRFTFGPRPGDEAAVKKMGLEKWFQMQLNPERIDDSGFEAQMQAFPAMQLNEADLMRRFPSPQMIRQTETRGAALADDPVERAVYADAEASYEAQRKKQEEAAASAVAAVPTSDNGTGMNGAASEGGKKQVPFGNDNQKSNSNSNSNNNSSSNSNSHNSNSNNNNSNNSSSNNSSNSHNSNSNNSNSNNSNNNSSSSNSSSNNSNSTSNRSNSNSNRSNSNSGSLREDNQKINNDGGPGGRAGMEAGQPPAVQAEAQGGMNSADGGMNVEEGRRTKSEVKALKHQVPVVLMGSEEVKAVLALAPEPRFQALVAMSPQESVSFRDSLRPVERLSLVQGFTPAQTETVEAMQAPVRLVGAEVLETRLLRDIESQRQLQAVMTDFWLNHFNVYVRKNQNEPYYLPAYERETILPNALGKFEDLLVATAKSPAMLMYLDNWESLGPDSVAAMRVVQAQKRNPNGKLVQKMPEGINENYGRELMELHTLGVGGGYTQKDVIEVAKCFTGWTIERPYGGGGAAGRFGMRANGGAMQDSAEPGQFVFNENRHEPGPKVVLGHTIPEGGMNEGLEVLHILATSPATAHFISQELAVRFVSDTPPPALVNRMAATFLKSDGDIKAVLTTMFHSKEFWSPKVYRAKVKTPVEFLASALRASDATVKNPLPLVQAMDRLGMPVYGMQTPNGYSWTADEWVSSNALISRMNFALALSGGRVPGTVTNWPALLGSAPDDSVVSSPTAETEQRLEGLLLGQPAAARTRATVLAQFSERFNELAAQSVAEASFNKPASVGFVRAGLSTKGGRGQQFNRPATPLDTMAGLLLGSPDFQRR